MNSRLKKSSTKGKPTKGSSNKGLAIGAIFVGAIAALLMVAGYVISIVAKNQAHKEKWKDYNDCGWA